MGIEDYIRTLFAAFAGNAQMSQQGQGQQNQAQQLSQMLGGTQQPNTTPSGGIMFAPDAQGNLFPVPEGTYGANAYMNQAPSPGSPLARANTMATGMFAGVPSAPNMQTLQSVMGTPEGVNAIMSALNKVYGGNP